MSIVRHNRRAKKGKKNWARNIDITDFIEDVEAQKLQAKLEKEAQEKIKDKQLFVIDEKPETGRRQRTPLDPNRFKKKEKELTASEDKVVSKLDAKVRRKAEEKEARANARIPENENIKSESTNDVDFWEEENVRKSIRPKHDEVKIPAVLPPHEGQSYNPTFRAHKELLDQVVEEETLKEKKKTENFEFSKTKKSDLELIKIIPLKKERREAREKAQRRIEKKQSHDFMYLKKIKKEIETEEEEQKRLLEERARKEEETNKLLEEGKIIRTKKLNRNKYMYPGTDFQLTSELKPNLRKVSVAGSLARDRFDSIFRRNLIEKTGYGKKKKKKSRIPKIKYHSTERGVKDEFDKFEIHN